MFKAKCQKKKEELKGAASSGDDAPGTPTAAVQEEDRRRWHWHRHRRPHHGVASPDFRQEEKELEDATWQIDQADC